MVRGILPILKNGLTYVVSISSLQYILHDWNDEKCVKILTKCYEALPPDGKVIALDNMLPEIINLEGADHIALQNDINMMAITESGSKERTESDHRKLGLAAGFREVKVICKVDMIAVTEFQK